MDAVEQIVTELTGPLTALGANRRSQQRDRYAILNDDYQAVIEQCLEQRARSRKNRMLATQFLDTSINALQMIVHAQAVVYSQSPSRTFSVAGDQSIWDETIDPPEHDLDLAMEQVNRIALACNECVVRPVFRGGRLELDVIPPHRIAVVADGMTPLALGYERETDETYSIWTPSANVIVSKRKEVLFSAPNPYGVLPFVVYRRAIPTDGFWCGTPGRTLLDGYLDQVLLRTWGNVLMFTRTSKQLGKRPNQNIVEGRQVTGRQQEELSPVSVLDGDYTVLDLSLDPRAYWAVADNKLRLLGQCHGISIEVNTAADGAVSATQSILSHSALKEVRDAQVKMFHASDLQLMQLIALIYNVDVLPVAGARRFSDEPRPQIEYAPLPIIQSEIDRLTEFQLKFDLNLASPIDYYREQHPDLSEDECRALWEETMAINTRQLEMRRAANPPVPETQRQGGRPFETPRVSTETPNNQ